MKTVIVDDEVASLESLNFDLERFDEIQIVGCFSSPVEALAFLDNNEVDLVFLDINMPEMTGFELLERVSSLSFDVIFVTAYEEHAIRAFDFNATDYILKPPIRSKLQKAVLKAAQRKSPLSKEEVDALSINYRQSKKGIEKIALPSSNGWEFVEINEIVFLQADGNYTKVYLDEAKDYLIARTLKSLSSVLDYPNFFRSHQSFLVNLNHVKKYVRSDGGYFELDSGITIPVASSRKAALAEIMGI